jgi:hypothetical protein
LVWIAALGMTIKGGSVGRSKRILEILSIRASLTDETQKEAQIKNMDPVSDGNGSVVCVNLQKKTQRKILTASSIRYIVRESPVING